MHASMYSPGLPTCLLCETDGAPALKAITFYSESITSFGNSPSLFEDTLSNISQMLLLISLSQAHLLVRHPSCPKLSLYHLNK